MNRSMKLFDWITLTGALTFTPVAIYYYNFEYLVAAALLALQSIRVIAYVRFCEQIEEELEYAYNEEFFLINEDRYFVSDSKDKDYLNIK